MWSLFSNIDIELGGEQNQNYDQWRASIEQNPMPINLQLDPYIFLIEDVVKRENMITALQTYINKSLGFDNTLQTAPVQQGIKKNSFLFLHSN